MWTRFLYPINLIRSASLIVQGNSCLYLSDEIGWKLYMILGLKDVISTGIIYSVNTFQVTLQAKNNRHYKCVLAHAIKKTTAQITLNPL